MKTTEEVKHKFKGIKAVKLKHVGDNSGEMRYGRGYFCEKLETGQIRTSFPDKGYVYIQKHRFVTEDGNVHGLTTLNKKLYMRMHAHLLENYRIYRLYQHYGEGGPIFVGLTRRQDRRFRGMCGELWFQKEANLRYIVNIFFLIVGVILTYMSIDNKREDGIQEKKKQEIKSQKLVPKTTKKI